MFTLWFRAHGARRHSRPATRRPRRRLGIESLEDRQVPAIFTVNTVGDAADANLLDGVADTDLLTPGLQTSLRAAIQQANATAGPDVIRFKIAGAGPHTIQPQSALPDITEAVIIDGYSQPGASPNTLPIDQGTNAQLRIELNGGLLTDGSSGLVLKGQGSTVKGLVINGFAFPDLGEPGSERHIPVGGIVLLGQGGHTVQGNFIGTDVAGLAARPNNFQGVYVASSENVIGGSKPEARNLVSGNQGFGVHITARAAPGDPLYTPAEYNRVLGNLIGTDRSGTQAVANTGAGVVLTVFARHNVIGGTAAGDRNVISGNGGPFTPYGDPGGPYQDWPDAPFAMSGGHGSGVHIENLTLATLANHSVPNAIIGNYIGTNAQGTAALPNQFRGVTLVFTNEVTVGHNLISGNEYDGVAISGIGASPVKHRVEQNRIGTDWTGLKPLGNGTNGIHLNQASGNRVFANTIAHNGATGVAVQNSYNPKTGIIYPSLGNTISRNSIHSNALLGIDLVKALGPDQDGPTANDALDLDQGPNGLLNFPVITAAAAGVSTSVSGVLSGLPSTTFRLEFFASAAPDSSGFGEGKRYLGSILVTTLASGNISFSVSGLATTAFGEWITTTATNLSDGSTSEFSRAVRLSGQPIGPLHVDVVTKADPIGPIPPCDPLAPVADTFIPVVFSPVGTSSAGSATEALDALLTRVGNGSKDDGGQIDLSQDLAQELVKEMA